MSTIKSFAVGDGDTFYINHNSSNFTIIDCFLCDENKERIVDDIKQAKAGKEITRFISTHPDEDHLQGLKYLDDEIEILNFYCVKNEATKEDESDDFKHYRSLKDSSKVFNISKGCTRKWMNISDETRGCSGIHVLWPVTDNKHFIEAHDIAKAGGSPNNISAIIRYSVENGPSFMWFGDLETEFMDKIADEVEWPKTDIVFASHHGRDTGKIPNSILGKIKPKIIILGEAPSRHLNYYGGYNIITQNSAGDITLECDSKKVHVFVSEPAYSVDFLDYEEVSGGDYYLGTLNI